ncbi:hypothetical protein [Marinigracilibium pacificum]|uniref:Uncharacterized protein n=1 Tax=Marinigracilibium pacificum TaxID=2729599 RepID=A0A848J0Z4_9BACT|nr:hypothetical protein [Marinigracilibium pacificum]NMM49341.1 hypothetical protein [Marinigracilibium pacificum]
MKSYIKIFLLGIFAVFISCDEDDELLKFSKAVVPITFGDDFPSYNGTFTTLDQVIIPVEATGAESVTVQSWISGEMHTYSITESSGAFEINEPWSSILGSVSVDSLEEAGGTVVLRTTATAGGESAFRDFGLSIANPISFDSGTPGLSTFGSDVDVEYNVKTKNKGIDRVEFFTKYGGADFQTSPVATVDAGGVTDFSGKSQTLTFPSEGDLGVGEAFTVAIVAVSTDGLSDTLTTDILAIEVPLSTEGVFRLLPDEFVVTPSTDTEPAILDTENNKFDFSEDSLIPDSENTEDISLGIIGGELVLEMGTGVTWVIPNPTEEFSGYESVRDAFNAGTPSSMAISNLTDKASLGGYIILKLSDLTGENQFVLISIDAVSLNAEVVDSGYDPITNSTVDISYRSNIP